MEIRFHPHALQKIRERGATEDEVADTVRRGEKFAVKFSRHGFRKNFAFDGQWRGKRYNTKQIEAYAIWENDGWLVITVMVKYY